MSGNEKRIKRHAVISKNKVERKAPRRAKRLADRAEREKFIEPKRKIYQDHEDIRKAEAAAKAKAEKDENKIEIAEIVEEKDNK